MPTIEVEVETLHKAQRQTDAESVRFNVWSCGRRYGKSVLSRRRLVRKAAVNLPTAYFAPTYKMLSQYWRETAAALFPILDKSNVQEKRLQLIGGGSIDMWSLDEPNAARGRKYAHVAIDEAAMIPRLGEAWQEVIRPTLADYEGSADFYSTPKGRNFFWQLWQRGQDPQQSDWTSWQMPTSANPYIKASEIEAARLELPERVFSQEYLAQFLEDGGGVFRRIMDCATAKPQERNEGHQYVIGVDWGRSADFTVICVIDTQTRELVYMDRFNQIEYSVQSGRLQAICERFKPDAVIAESNSIGEPIIDRLRKDYNMPVRPFQTTNATKAQVIDALALAFERGDIAILNDAVLISELQAYEMERLPSGLIRYGAPESMHDDCVMSLALAWYGANKGGIEVEESAWDVLGNL